MKIILPLLFCLPILISACTVGPDFKTPASPAVSAYTAKDEALSTEQRIALGLQVQSE